MKNWFFYAGSCYECEKNARYYSLICLGVMLFFLAIAMVVFADKVDSASACSPICEVVWCSVVGVLVETLGPSPKPFFGVRFSGGNY